MRVIREYEVNVHESKKVIDDLNKVEGTTGAEGLWADLLDDFTRNFDMGDIEPLYLVVEFVREPSATDGGAADYLWVTTQDTALPRYTVLYGPVHAQVEEMGIQFRD